MPIHPSHQTRGSDASTFDVICERCGATDQVPGGFGALAEPCPSPEETPEIDLSDYVPEVLAAERAEATKIGLDLLRLAGHPDWRVEWSEVAPSECWEDSKRLMMWSGLLGNPWWYVKEAFIHEIAHIGTGKPTDSAEQRHGPAFFRRFGELAVLLADYRPESARGGNIGTIQ